MNKLYIMASTSLEILRLSLSLFAEFPRPPNRYIIHSTCLPSSDYSNLKQFYQHLANMGHLPSHTFCRCIPVRLGVLIMSILGCIGGSVMAGFGWNSAVHKGKRRLSLLYRVLIVFVDETYLTTNQEVSVVMASLSYTLLGAISLLGSVCFVPSNSVQYEGSLCTQVDWSCH